MINNRKGLFFLFTLFSLCWLASCTGTDANDKEEVFIPQASGKVETVVVIMDSSLKAAPLGKTIDSILSFSLPGLLFEEQVLTPQYIHPDNFGKVWERFRHLFIPLTLSGESDGNSRIRSYFTDELLANKDRDFFSFIKKDVFAEGQDAYVVVGKDLKTLEDSLPKILEKIRYFYDQSILSALKSNLKRNAQDAVENYLGVEYGLSFLIPQGFGTAVKDTNFIWLRKAHEDYDLNTFMAFKPYTSENQFNNEQILAWRNTLGKKYLLGTDSFMETEKDPTPYFEEQNINGLYTKVGRGLWHMSGDNFMGGYFVSYTFVDESRDRLYYLESFLYYPRKNTSKKYWYEKMRKYREGEAIINSFKIK